MVSKTTRRNAGWEDELAQEAEKTRGQAAAAKPGTGGGPRLSVRAGILSLGGKELKNNELECVVVDFAHENAYYADAYDPENPVPPSCYALGRDEESLEPSDKAEEKQSEACSACQQNEFGSAEVGRGKACKNSYRMVLWVPDDDEEEPTLVTLTAKLTVFKELEDYIESCINDLHRPYWSVLTNISAAPDRKSQFRLTFDLKDKLDKEQTQTVKELRADKTEEILFSEFPSREQVEARRAAKVEAEDSGKRRTKLTRTGPTSVLKKVKAAKR